MKAVMQPRFGGLSPLLCLLLAASPCSPQEQEHDVAGALHESFLRCVASVSPATADPSRIVHAPSEPSYPSLLNATIQNLRFASPRTPYPTLLLTPATAGEARACVACCRRHGLTVRARSGGHDYEGLSYRSVLPRAAGARPFAVVDVAALRDVRVDPARREARVGPGATLGELYYVVARESGGTLGFPAGICPTVCVGGHLSGGGFGPMMRKHGLAADNVVGAEVVDAEGRLLDRAAMGEGLFWALRGGGGGSFGVVVSWTVRLVPVPRVVSAFTVLRLLRRGDQRQTQSTLRLLKKWQRVAHALPDDLFVKAAIEPKLDSAGERHPLVVFKSLFLGNCSGMVAEMSTHLPELGVKPSDCRDMSWIQSMLYFYGYTNGQPAEVLLDRTLQPKDYYKIKLDYLTSPIPAAGLAGLLARIVEDRGGSIDIDPQGGAMGATPESATPYAHRRRYLYNVQYFVKWGGDANVSYEDGHLGWVRGVHGFMAPYASSRPRAAYINFRDLDLGRNVEGETSYEAARAWGEMYFRGNFRRLAMVKGEVDPEQVFWSEQSIPPLVVADAGEKQSESGLVSDS
ncbi:cannabidiolic acid synthase-like [Panicum miliaceum]|uniref:Cannabidiolic acid synthase-like n=1 Tax=Panicum miliaceum TaxID=4540 RepID=A0A3L6QMW4_PANMI|nr:cannabidiolic acid synthase-like [Panicum miliaceum]